MLKSKKFAANLAKKPREISIDNFYEDDFEDFEDYVDDFTTDADVSSRIQKKIDKHSFIKSINFM